MKSEHRILAADTAYERELLALQLAAVPWRLARRIVKDYYRRRLTEATTMLERDSTMLADTLIEFMEELLKRTNEATTTD